MGDIIYIDIEFAIKSLKEAKSDIQTTFAFKEGDRFCARGWIINCFLKFHSDLYEWRKEIIFNQYEYPANKHTNEADFFIVKDFKTTDEIDKLNDYDRLTFPEIAEKLEKESLKMKTPKSLLDWDYDEEDEDEDIEECEDDEEFEESEEDEEESLTFI